MGSSFSNPFSQDREDLNPLSAVHHRWVSEGRFEHAFVYRDAREQGTCVTYCGGDELKVIYTFYDAMGEDNRVAVNIEFVAVHDGGGGGGDRLYKFGGIKVKHFGEKFTVRRQRSFGPEVLFLSYVMEGRNNELACNRGVDNYRIEFRSSCPLVSFVNLVRVAFHPTRGLYVRAGITRYLSKVPSSITSVEPPNHVIMKDLNDVRSQLMEDDNTTGVPSSQHIYNSGNLVYNEQILAGGNIYDQ